MVGLSSFSHRRGDAVSPPPTTERIDDSGQSPSVFSSLLPRRRRSTRARLRGGAARRERVVRSMSRSRETCEQNPGVGARQSFGRRTMGRGGGWGGGGRADVWMPRRRRRGGWRRGRRGVGAGRGTRDEGRGQSPVSGDIVDGYTPPSWPTTDRTRRENRRSRWGPVYVRETAGRSDSRSCGDRPSIVDVCIFRKGWRTATGRGGCIGLVIVVVARPAAEGGRADRMYDSERRPATRPTMWDNDIERRTTTTRSRRRCV
jgi:hypothetical protein